MRVERSARISHDWTATVDWSSSIVDRRLLMVSTYSSMISFENFIETTVGSAVMCLVSDGEVGGGGCGGGWL